MRMRSPSDGVCSARRRLSIRIPWNGTLGHWSVDKPRRDGIDTDVL